MSKKYLSLEEAANLLNIPTSELMRMREQGEIRGFADRGNWKFKVDDVEAMARTRSDDSSPEVPLFAEDDGDVGEQPTIISKGPAESDASILTDDGDEDDSLADEESDVLLVGDGAFDLDDSDSDVKLVGLDSAAEIPTENDSTTPEVNLSGSDSDVRLSADSDSDSDVSLMDSATLTSFEAGDGGSDSDVKLISDDKDESDVTLISNDDQEAVALDLSGDDISVFDDESGISLAGDSSLMLGGESGISLEGPADSGMELASDDDDEGITLDLGDDSGISLEMDESGIALADDDDSGISLEADDMSGTIPMMNTLDEDSVPETQFEIPSLEDEDSNFDLDAEETGVLDMSDLEDSAGDGVFDLDEDDDVDEFAASDTFGEDDLDLEDDVFDDDEDLDVFDADDDVFDDEDEDVGYAGVRGMPAAEAEWGTGIFAGLIVASLLMLLCGAVMFDLLNNMTSAASANPISSAILDALGGLYGG